MATTATGPEPASVEAFVREIADERKRSDSRRLIELMGRVTGHRAVMWGAGIIGFGRYHYRYESGHEGDACLVGFSPRRAEFSIYMSDLNGPPGEQQRDELLKLLGRHRMGKGCLYLKRVDDIDMVVLERLLRLSAETLTTRYGAA